MKAIALALMAAAGIGCNAQVVINEIMQSNIDCIMDDLNDFPDSWLELYNASASSVNIGGYRLGLEEAPAEAWTLPDAVIPAGGHLLVYCDKADTGLHANFRIDSGKGALYLFDAAGNQIDAIKSIKKQPAPNIAYGRESDGAGKWGYELTPTPGATNAGGISNTILPEVIFSEPGGVWSNSSKRITIELSLPEDAPEGTHIRYTTDGSEPTANNGIEYTSRVIFMSSGVLRAKAFCDGCISIPSTAHSYIQLGREQQIPLISIITDDRYLNDSQIGIFYNNPDKEEEEKNYFQDWRRPINVEFFTPDGTEAEFNQLAEMRIQGGYTRRNSLKSLALYANKRFGTKRFDYEFWPSDKPGVTDNKSIILRNGGNDFGWAYIRDALIQRVVGRNTDAVDWQGYSPAIVYINGNYYAMLAIRERSNEDNIAANYDGLEDIDLYENWNELKTGTPDARDAFVEFLQSTHSLSEWEQHIDLASYCTMMAADAWVYNTDFPNNNIVMWRRTEGDDTRWRFLLKDLDFGFGAWNNNNNIRSNFITYMNDGWDDPSLDVWGHTLWRNLWANNGFKSMMADYMVSMYGDYLRYDVIDEYLDELYQETCGEQAISHKKWGEWWSKYDDNIGFINSWAKQRNSYMSTLMEKSFGYTGHASVSINDELDKDVAEKIYVEYAGMPLKHGTFEGVDYVGRNIEVYSPDATGWKVSIDGKETTYSGNDFAVAVQKSSVYKINAIVEDIEGIGAVSTDTDNYKVQDGCIIADEAVEIFDLAGRKVASGTGRLSLPSQGAYIIRSNGKAVLTVDR